MGFWGDRVNELNWGQFVVGKIQWIVSMTILLKVFDAPAWIYFAAPVVIFVSILLIGRLFNAFLRKPYLKAYFKDFKL